MKKLTAFICAVVLFLGTCMAGKCYYIRILNQKETELVYFNTDTRNNCIEGMKTILDSETIPVFGSSELSAADDVAYPKSLFRDGNSNFNMVLIGRGYMQSLHHAVNIGALERYFEKRKAVLILSPQWFTKSHLSSEIYSSRFSEQVYVEFLKNNKISKSTKRKVTERLESLLTADPKQLQRLEKYKHVYLDFSLNPVKYIEMMAYSQFMDSKRLSDLANEIKNISVEKDDKIDADKIDFDELLIQAEQAGAAACTNNDLYIYDEYYDTYVYDLLDERKNSEVLSSYLDSPEYDDLRLFFDVCKETGVEPLIVSIPVNGRWYDWTGFPKEERLEYYQKIRDLCNEYQVALLDFSDKEYEEYFLKDIMHLGWKGWAYLDEAVYEFYKEN